MGPTALTIRNKFRGSLASLAIALWLASGQPAAFAKTLPLEAQASAAAAAGWHVAAGGLSLDAVVAQVEQRYKARVVRAETRQEKGRTIYVLRLLNADGKVWTVRVDADSGAVL